MLLPVAVNLDITTLKISLHPGRWYLHAVNVFDLAGKAGVSIEKARSEKLSI